jgi:predicted esterase YcpF (UPF0227 family)
MMKKPAEWKRKTGAGIFYCHGFGSSFDPRKEKIRALTEVLPVHGVTVDYTLPPQEVFRQTLIIGTSLGGFFAAWLGAEFGLPFIAINPSIEPRKSLRAYLGHGVNHTGERFEMTADCVKAYDTLAFRMGGQGTVVLDMGDEVLDARATLNVVDGHLPVITFEGGSHRFDHMSDLIETWPNLFRIG